MENLSYYVFNIKLQSDKTDKDRTDEYIRIIDLLTSKPYKLFPVSKTEAIVFYESMKVSDRDFTLYLYGRAAKGLFLSGNERQVLQDGKIVVEANNPEVVINPEIVRYLFLPSRHRLFLERKPGGPSQFEVEKMLKEVLSNVVSNDDLLEIVLEKDESAIREIFAAKAVHSVSYTVSYSNEDFLKDLAKTFDAELKANNIGEISVTAKADNHQEGLNIEGSPILGGGLKLAENNGVIKRASITPDDGSLKRKVVTNKDKPKLLMLKIKETDNFWDQWFIAVKNLYSERK